MKEAEIALQNEYNSTTGVFKTELRKWVCKSKVMENKMI